MMLSKGLCRVACAVLASLVCPGLASAADLGGYDTYGDYDSSPYDDPRYADIYRHPTPRADRHEDWRGGDEAYEIEEAPYSRQRVWRDGRPLGPQARAPRFRDDRYHPDAVCIPPRRIRAHLIEDGWRNLQVISRQRGGVQLRARRAETGRPFILSLDRCSGRIVRARPARWRTYGAYRPWPDR